MHHNIYVLLKSMATALAISKAENPQLILNDCIVQYFNSRHVSKKLNRIQIESRKKKAHKWVTNYYK